MSALGQKQTKPKLLLLDEPFAGLGVSEIGPPAVKNVTFDLKVAHSTSYQRSEFLRTKAPRAMGLGERRRGSTQCQFTVGRTGPSFFYASFTPCLDHW
jgi:hypothetical protein